MSEILVIECGGQGSWKVESKAMTGNYFLAKLDEQVRIRVKFGPYSDYGKANEARLSKDVDFFILNREQANSHDTEAVDKLTQKPKL